jgi:hypothetical protein
MFCEATAGEHFGSFVPLSFTRLSIGVGKHFRVRRYRTWEKHKVTPGLRYGSKAASRQLLALLKIWRQLVALLGHTALIISVVSLIFSGITLYDTVLKQPRLTIFSGCSWQYGRGPGSFDEYLIIPITIANDGARRGTVLAIELVVDKGGPTKEFNGSYTVISLDDKERQLFAPLTVFSRESATASIVFTQRGLAGPALFVEAGRYRANLRLRTTLDVSYGFMDWLFPNPTPQTSFELLVRRFEIAAILGGERAAVESCAQTSMN